MIAVGCTAITMKTTKAQIEIDVTITISNTFQKTLMKYRSNPAFIAHVINTVTSRRQAIIPMICNLIIWLP